MMKALLENEWKVLINTFRTTRRSHLISYLILFIVLGGFMYVVCKGIWSMGPLMTAPLFDGVLSYGFLMLLGFVFLIGVPQVFNTMYSAKDLEFLFTLPIRTRHIFLVKYLKSFITVPLFAVVVFIIPLITFGFAIEANFLFYPMVLFVLLLLTSIGLSIAYLFNLILIQIIPASRASEFITFMSFLSGLVVYFVIIGPSMFTDEPFTDLLLTGLPPLPGWLPTSWGSEALVGSAYGLGNVIVPFLLLILMAALSVALSIMLVERGFRTGWIRLSEGSGTKKKKRKNKKAYSVHHPIVAVGKKEWMSIRRDVREWLFLMPVAIFFVVGIFSFFGSGVVLSDLRGFNQITWPVVQLIMMFLYSIASGNVAASSIGREGNFYWQLQSLPLSGREIALGKLWPSWLLPFILLTIIEIVFGLLLGWELWQYVLGILIKAVLSIGFSTLGIWIGTIGAKYDPINPQARLTFSMSIILMILSWIYLLIVMVPFGYIMFPAGELELPANLDHGTAGMPGFFVTIFLRLLLMKVNYPVVMTIVGFIVLTVIAIGLSQLFMLFAARKIDKGIQIDIVSKSSSKPLFGRKR